MIKTMAEERTSLLTVEQFKQLARPTGNHIDEEEVKVFIRECEDSFIIPAIGYERFKASIGQGDFGDSVLPGFNADTFIDGGEYSVDGKDSSCKDIKVLKYTSGIRKSLAYFVYAKILRSDGTIVSRSGAMRHRDDYSDHVDDSSLKQYNDIMGMAESYLSDTLLYLKATTKAGEVKPHRSTRVRIHAIGD